MQKDNKAKITAEYQPDIYYEGTPILSYYDSLIDTYRWGTPEEPAVYDTFCLYLSETDSNLSEISGHQWAFNFAIDYTK